MEWHKPLTHHPVAIAAAAALVGAVLLLPAATPFVLALALATTCGLLATFSGCAQIQIQPEAFQKLTKEQQKLLGKALEIQALRQKIKELKTGFLGLPTGAITEMGEIGRLNEKIEAIEKDQTAELQALGISIEEAANEYKNLKTSQSIVPKSLKSLGNVKLGGPGGLGDLNGVGELATLVEKRDKEISALIRRNEQQLARAAALVETRLIPSARALQRADSKIQPNSELTRAERRAFAAGDAAYEDLRDGLIELFLIDFDEGLDVLADYARLLSGQAPMCAIVPRSAEQSVFRLTADVPVDETAVGPLRRGDVLAFELPPGFRLTRRVRVAPSRGVRVKVHGNEAGSSGVVVIVQSAPEAGSGMLRLRIDQDISVDVDAPLTGRARVMNVCSGVESAIPVVALPTS